MKHTKPFYTLALAGLLLLAGCDAKNAAETNTVQAPVPAKPEMPDTIVTDTLTQQPQDGVVVEHAPDSLKPQVPADTEKAPAKVQPPRKSRQQDLPKPQPEATPVPEPVAEESTTGFREGTYQLISVQGDGLPLVMDMTTDCDTRLMQGVLVLKDGLFQFGSHTEEACKDTPPSQEKHEAAGSYRLEKNRIFLNIRYGDALGDASGLVEAGGRLRLQQIGSGEERQAVDWVFARQ